MARIPKPRHGTRPHPGLPAAQPRVGEATDAPGVVVPCAPPDTIDHVAGIKQTIATDKNVPIPLLKDVCSSAAAIGIIQAGKSGKVTHVTVYNPTPLFYGEREPMTGSRRRHARGRLFGTAPVARRQRSNPPASPVHSDWSGPGRLSRIAPWPTPRC